MMSSKFEGYKVKMLLLSFKIMFCKIFSPPRSSLPRSTRSQSRRSSWPRALWATPPATRSRTSLPPHSGAVIFTALDRKRRPWPDVQCRSGKCLKNLGIRFGARQKWNAKFTCVALHRWNLRRQKLLRHRVFQTTEWLQSKNSAWKINLLENLIPRKSFYDLWLFYKCSTILGNFWHSLSLIATFF